MRCGSFDNRPMRWDVFCRVVDNFGDIGFAWRLAADLAGRGESVRLLVDDASALAWLEPAGAAVQVAGWEAARRAAPDVRVETFGCGVPELLVGADDALHVNVEHLSAERFVDRSHGLPSPRQVDGRTITTWFYYPGFVPGTGGLLREPGLLARRASFGDGRDWLAAHDIARRDAERCVSLFCYAEAALPAWLELLAREPTLLLLAPGPAEQAATLLGPSLRRGGLRAIRLPFLDQDEYDRLLWSCDLNVVRGEDSLVRAIWAGAPFLWQLYPQADGAHRPKLAAFLGRLLAGAPPGLAAPVEALFGRLNGSPCASAEAADLSWPETGAWARHCRGWRDRLAALPDLTTGLLGFVASKR